ncbi:hypothetical protein Hdeb2414_s0758g00943851 [Helianthus debilis subsp. tardiflorus]
MLIPLDYKPFGTTLTLLPVHRTHPNLPLQKDFSFTSVLLQRNPFNRPDPRYSTGAYGCPLKRVLL